METVSTKKQTLDEILLEKIDFSNLNEEEKKKAIEDIKNTILENTLIRLMETSNKEDADRFEAFLEGEKSPEEIISYLEKNFPSFNKILFEEVEFLKSI